MLRIGLIGDFDPAVIAHQAIPRALDLAASAVGVEIENEWLATDEIDGGERLSAFDGLWCVPASPYRSMDGALAAIRFAREEGRPFLGTCGGFQHALIEYARNVLGWADASHAETDPGAGRTVVAPLVCSLVEVSGSIRLLHGTRIAAAYDADQIVEGYHCSYGLDPAYRAALLSGLLRVSAEDAAGEVRAVELEGHPFFVATLFQPEHAALTGSTPPLVRAFVQACAARGAAPMM